MTDAEALAVVAFLQTAFPRTEWREDTVSLWVEELRAYDLAPARDAARECFRRHKFVPSMAEFLDLLRQAMPRYVHPRHCVCEGTGWVQTIEPLSGPVRHPSHLKALRTVRCQAATRVLASSPAAVAELPPAPDSEGAARVHELGDWMRQQAAKSTAALALGPDRPRYRVRVDETAMPMPKRRRRGLRKPKPPKESAS